MRLSTTLSGATLLAALALSSGSQAAILVTMDPSNEGLTPVSSSYGPFTASGALGGMSSSLTIDGYNVAGLQNYSETGRIVINQWTGGTSGSVFQPSFNPSLTYGIYADFSLSGKGLWSVPGSLANCGALLPTCSTFNAATANFTATVYGVAQGGTIGTPTLTLGTLSLRPDFAVSALAILDLASGNANTSLTAVFDFLPAAGTTGPGNFFISYPGMPLSFIFSSSNVGGNFLNTSFDPLSPADGDSITIATPGAQPNLGQYPGSFNVTFDQQVPEPGSIALVGLAMTALAAVGRRNRRSKV